MSYDTGAYFVESIYDKLIEEHKELTREMKRVEDALNSEKKRLRALVKVRETKTFWELSYNGRTLRVKPNARGEFKVTENGVKVNTYGFPHSIPALKLALATDRI